MKMLFFMFIIIMTLMVILTTILNLVSKKSFSDREKSSPFECGFDPKSHSRLPFSLQFFLISIIFLIFDIEIAILLPMIYSMKTSSMLSFSLTTILFILILLGGLIHEWKQGSLNWSI
uniref:NADH-ubiquinone oxidoreductase chain 3 n=1 Tax=Chrysomeloidea sp. 1 KM-2017 TaxID=2219295 RepID=A0A346RJN7_9CUCU|nr:NADH dehydrogenase subunit 3 [Chrysomeloidea sp. 1 KM-2017]